MPSADFERSLTVGRSPVECWGVLTDVGLVANWVTVVGEVSEIEHLQTYQAVLADQFGPFRLKEEMRVAKRLGASMVITGSGGPSGLQGARLKEAVKRFAESMKPHLAAAEELGITIGIENHGGPLISTPESAT